MRIIVLSKILPWTPGKLHTLRRSFEETCKPFAQSLLSTSKSSEPTFSAVKCHEYFKDIFSSQHCQYEQLPPFVHKVIPKPSVSLPFDLSPVTPKQIRTDLRKCSSNSSPGCNGITHHHLKNLPCLHHILATLYSKILLKDQTCPDSWCIGRINLLHKDDDTLNPANFRPIAITCVVGKLFHRLLLKGLSPISWRMRLLILVSRKAFFLLCMVYMSMYLQSLPS